MGKYSPKMDEPVEHIILFDGICNLCNGFVRFVIRRDKNGIFKFASLQSDIGQEMLSRLGLPRNEFESFVLIQGDKYYLKSTGILKMLRELPSVWKLCYVFILIPRFIRDFLYGVIAKSRYKIFGRQDACMIPTAELQERFL
jgi:predicted DCC family thiol-disulfide oxidoreductase YuxK